MSDERCDNDVLEVELPAYQEDSFAVPDIEPEGSFAENKDDIFLRNMIIAAKEARPPVRREDAPRKIDAEEFFARNDLLHRDRRSERGFFSKLITAFTEHSRELKIIYLLAMVAIVTIMMVMLVLAFQIRGKHVTNRSSDVVVQQVTEITVTMQYDGEQATDVMPYSEATVT